MKMLSLALNTENLGLSEDEIRPPEELAANLMKNIMIAYGTQRQGLSFVDQRSFNKISDAVELAVKEGRTSVELEDRDYAFLVKSMKESKLVPAKIINRVFDLIEAAA